MSHFNPLPSTFANRVKKPYTEECMYKSRQTSKLDSYSPYKVFFKVSPYTHVHDPYYRKALSELQTTNHNLQVELGRCTEHLVE